MRCCNISCSIFKFSGAAVGTVGVGDSVGGVVVAIVSFVCFVVSTGGVVFSIGGVVVSVGASAGSISTFVFLGFLLYLSLNGVSFRSGLIYNLSCLVNTFTPKRSGLGGGFLLSCTLLPLTLYRRLGFTI